MWARIASWRFWVLVAVTVVDGVAFVIPIALTAMVLGAIAAPDWLRKTARFLDALADGH